MANNPYRPKGKADNNMVVPLIAVVAITVALALGWVMMNTSDENHAANPMSQSSSTGASSGETGQSTIQNNPDAKANPGAGAAPTKAPNSDPSAADTQPQQTP